MGSALSAVPPLTVCICASLVASVFTSKKINSCICIRDGLSQIASVFNYFFIFYFWGWHVPLTGGI